eukprot:scaffold270_cov121-Isochrysis_galbana.AAC.33
MFSRLPLACRAGSRLPAGCLPRRMGPRGPRPCLRAPPKRRAILAFCAPRAPGCAPPVARPPACLMRSLHGVRRAAANAGARSEAEAAVTGALAVARARGVWRRSNDLVLLTFKASALPRQHMCARSTRQHPPRTHTHTHTHTLTTTRSQKSGATPSVWQGARGSAGFGVGTRDTSEYLGAPPTRHLRLPPSKAEVLRLGQVERIQKKLGRPRAPPVRLPTRTMEQQTAQQRQHVTRHMSKPPYVVRLSPSRLRSASLLGLSFQTRAPSDPARSNPNTESVTMRPTLSDKHYGAWLLKSGVVGPSAWGQGLGGIFPYNKTDRLARALAMPSQPGPL